MNIALRRARNRQMIIFLLVCAGMLTLLARLYYWQILRGQQLARYANEEHLQNQVLNAPRGLIYDAQGHLLVTNVVRDDVYIEPVQFAADHQYSENRQGELALLIHTLHQVLPDVAEDKLYRIFDTNLQTYRIAGPISPQQSQQLHKLHMQDVFLEPHTVRTYPGGDLAAQVLGYVTLDGKGLYGIEGQHDALLAGKPGSFMAETDLNGNPLTVGVSSGQPALSGADLTLTIDSNVQYMVQQALADTVKGVQASSGTVIVMDARSGAIVAMAGIPSFDPNHYGAYSDQVGCLGDESVYFNPALYCAYEPGSTMKAVTMAAALDQGLITPNTTLNDPGYINFHDGTPTVTNWAYKGYGAETMTQVLEHSSNVGAAYVAHNILGPQRYYPYLERFGFGQTSPIAGPEATGSYRTNTSSGWTPSDLARQAFGQSILATPLQMALAYQTIANGGVMMRPYLVAVVNDNGHVTTTQPQVKQRVISAQTARLLTGMLVSAANYNNQATFPGYSVAVKTGTATTQGLPTDQTEASMAGFAPASNPRFVILVKIDRPQATIYGSTAAGPLWKSIAQQLMFYYNVPPDLSLERTN
ncbi:MAG: penicillin-binding protein 2 [Ktedonobacteraceae bacterium]|nr:penicillin-binding protein 2 [Ktedonobacteraceae bacterium]